MPQADEQPVFRDIATLLAARSGLDVYKRDAGMFERRIRERMQATGCEKLATYHGLLVSEEKERILLDESLRVGETRFFRDMDHFAYLNSVEIPGKVKALSDAWVRSCHFLSVGCSNGAEAWSMAICLASVEWPDNTDWRVTGLDLSHTAVKKAARGFYTLEELRGLDKPLQTQWFDPLDDGIQVKDTLRVHGSFHQVNVLDPDFATVAGRPADVVFFKNVLIYLNPSAARRAFQHVAARVKPGGLLVLAPSEMQMGLADENFSEIYHGRTVLYRRLDTLKGGRA